MRWWEKINLIVNVRRQNYIWLAGGALWIAWLISIILGSGNKDLANQVIGTDYIHFYAAGVTVRAGMSSLLYNFTYRNQIEQQIVPNLNIYNAVNNPPFFAWLYVPFSMLPYLWSYLSYCVFGLILLWLSLYLLNHGHIWRSFFISLTWFPVFTSFSFGQNGIISLFISALIFYFWDKRRLFLAGLMASLLLYKPQLLLGIGFFWILDWRQNWKSLAGFSFGAGILGGLMLWLMPGALNSYIQYSLNIYPMLIGVNAFHPWHSQTLGSFFLMIFSGNAIIARCLHIIIALIGLAVFIRFWQVNRLERPLLFTGAILLTFLTTPYAMVYDWCVLLIPAVLLWKYYPDLRGKWKAYFVFMWAASFVSDVLSYLELQYFSVAIQLSVVVFLFIFVDFFSMYAKLPTAFSLRLRLNRDFK